MELEKLIAALKKDEGSNIVGGRHRLYKCPSDKWTIGYGRNLEANGISESEATGFLIADAIEAHRVAAALIPNWFELDDVRQNVLANMAYNMGGKALSGFKKLLAAANIGDHPEAAAQILDSKFATQVPNRASRLANEMLIGGK
jgi:lysozyme